MTRFLERLNALILLVMFLVTTFQIVARTILQISSVWSEELARFLFVCIVFLGAAVVMQEEGHIRISVLTDRVGGTAARLIRILTGLVTLPFIGVLTWGAYLNMVRNWNVFAPTLEWLRIGYLYLTIFGTGLLMLWYLAVNLAKELRMSAAKSRSDSPRQT